MLDLDVFVSYDRTDAAPVRRIATALEAAGLRVFLDTEQIRLFESIPDRVRHALEHSRVLLVYYSRSYGSRRACQEEFITAYLAGPERVLAVNPEPGVDHLTPREIREVLLPGHPVTESAVANLVDAVRARSAALRDPIGSQPRSAGLPALAKFTGRWKELWQLHSALHDGGTAVVHGVVDVGKTTLAHAYLQLFGQMYHRVFFGNSPSAAVGDLVVLDEVTAPPEHIPDGTSVLLLTRDRQLAKLGTAIELTDLRDDELDLDPALRTAAKGSTGLAHRLAVQFSGSPDSVLDRLHGFGSPLLEPLAERLLPATHRTGESGWDLVRALVAIAPEHATRDLLNDILARAVGPAEVDAGLAQLLAAGILVDDGVGHFALPPAFRLVLRQKDPRPGRAEQVREAAVELLADRTRPPHIAIAPRRRSDLDEAERRTAHRIYNELASRIALRELPDSEGLLRGALASLHVLFDRLRQISGEVDPDVLRPSTPVRPGLSTLIHQLREEILRPFLTRWHPRLDDHHDIRPPGIGSRDHELAWPMHAQMRTDLATLQTEVAEVAAKLAVLSGNPLS